MIVLHCANLCWVGGVGEFIKSYARAFPEFQHHVLFLRDIKENYEYHKSFQTLGIRTYHNREITEELIDNIKPKILILHNPPNPLIPKINDLKILQKTYVIQFYHNKCKIFPHVDLHIFVSNWVLNAYKDFQKCIQKNKIVHPCVDESPYINIKREYTNRIRKVTVGRIQSNTNAHLGKFSEDVKILKKLKNAKFFLVGEGYEKIDDPRFTFAPLIYGAMKRYLEKVDIFYIWGGNNHTESWSRVVTEAMISAIPVVVKNNNDGLAEQVRKSKVGFLVETEKEFIETVQKLINDPELRKKHGEMGREWASQNLTIKNLRQNLINEMFEFGVT